MWPVIAAHISDTTGAPFTVREQRSVAGGCIHSAYVVAEGHRRYFVKVNDATHAEPFAAEAQGLQALAQAGAVRVPQPICWGVANDSAYLVLEYLELGGSGSGSLQRLGRELAALHHCTAARFGWHRANVIGSTPQENDPSDDWLEFWRERRLGFQLALAARHGYGGPLQRKGERLLSDFAGLFRGYRPVPALLHGDLWSGNYGVTPQGEPVIFDPAVYYGDHEADLAMTELFGGFGTGFYQAYQDHYPLDPGYRVRKTLYNLYHVLNHLNLFGGGYGAQAERMMEALLAELGS